MLINDESLMMAITKVQNPLESNPRVFSLSLGAQSPIPNLGKFFLGEFFQLNSWMKTFPRIIPAGSNFFFFLWKNREFLDLEQSGIFWDEPKGSGQTPASGKMGIFFLRGENPWNLQHSSELQRNSQIPSTSSHGSCSCLRNFGNFK